MLRLAWVGFLAAFLFVAAAGCKKTEYSLLISADSVSHIDTVRVRILPLDHSRSVSSSGLRFVDKDASALHTDPLRIAIPFDHEVDVLVQVIGQGAGTFVATRCYHIGGVVRDTVMLVALDSAAVDIDGDGFVASPAALCSDPDGAGGLVACDFACADDVAADCQGCVGSECPVDAVDHNGSIYPGAPEICEDNVDQDCNGVDAACGDNDHDGSSACSASSTAGACDCDDQDPARNPMAADACGDGIDQDCNGTDAFCDRDGDGVPADVEVGGRPDCDDTNPSVRPGATEVCQMPGQVGVDENCNGIVDELASCVSTDRDRDGNDACTGSGATGCDVNDCDPGIFPAAPEHCGNGVDEDCSGADLTCNAHDADKDGDNSVATGDGADCNDADPTIFDGAPEKCSDGIRQDCSNAEFTCTDADADGDHYEGTSDCAEGDATINPSVAELCNGVDDDCDGVVDEVLIANADHGCVAATSGAAARTSVTFNTTLDCGSCRHFCNPGTEVVADACVPDPSAGNAPTCDCAGDATIGACDGGPTSTCCSGIGCVNTMTDFQHCGSCSAEACSVATADACVGGACMCGTRAACSAGQICCGGTCVDSNTDIANCGGCGNACTNAEVPNASPECRAGRCEVASCNDGYADCPLNPGAGCETSTHTSANCGGCGIPCAADRTCATGTCEVQTCPAGQGHCDPMMPDLCVPLNSTTNCGGCNIACSFANGTAMCGSDLACHLAGCTGSFGNCDGMESNGCEADTNTSTNHCGACTAACATDDVHATMVQCVGGTCRADGACAADYADCDLFDGVLICSPENLSNTCNDCGSACVVANGVASCDGGTCHAASCDALYDTCTGPNVCDSLSTAAHCGSCAGTCSPGLNETADCSSGTTCARACATGFSDCDMGAAFDCRALDTTSNCGACDMACTPAPGQEAACISNMCDYACDSSHVECNGNAADGCEPINTALTDTCNACHVACVSGNVTAAMCVSGACVATSCAAGFDINPSAPSSCDNGTLDNACGTSLTDCGSGNFCCQTSPGSHDYVCQGSACT